jgi:diguanylate cyclase (GGDEF)-like protein/PAS domain S-box-containing protein
MIYPISGERLISRLDELERENAELEAINNKLEKRSIKYYQAFLLNPDPVAISDLKKGCYVEVNEAFLKVNGYERQDVIGRPYTEFGFWVNQNEFDQANKILVEHNGIRDFEAHFRIRNGEIRTVLLSGEVIMVDGEPFLVTISKDITDRKLAEAALLISEEKFAKAFYGNPDPMIITVLEDGTYVEVNDAWIEATGYERHEAIGHTSIDLSIWAASEERDETIKQIRDHGCISGYETRFRSKYGKIGIYLFSAEIIHINDKQYLVCVNKNITDSKRNEEALRLSQEQFSKAFNASPITMVISSLKEGRFIAVNDSFCRIIGHNRNDTIGRTSLEIGFWLDPADRIEVIDKILRGETIRDLEISFSKKDGSQRLGLFSAEGLELDGKACILSNIIDITERKQDEEYIRYLSFHDKLTGLYNRAYFEEELKRIETGRQLPISIIMGDVNGLKLVNDALGHLEGDKLLKAVAGILKKSCRQEDIIARWGGDEFIILLPKCDSKTANNILERIKKADKVNNPLPIDVSISLGLATKDYTTQKISEVIKEAEDKMYRTKLLEARSNRSSFLHSLEKTLWERDSETEEHCRRMQEIASRIGQALDLPDSDLDNLKLLAALHDIGKIAISNSILAKPGKLTPEEWETVKKHPEIGYRISLSAPEMAPIAEATLHHHECWDGTGYPLGLEGKQIPLLARIIAIADTYDVLTHGRPYQDAVNKKDAWTEIKRCSGRKFDPDLVRIALEVSAEL